MSQSQFKHLCQQKLLHVTDMHITGASSLPLLSDSHAAVQNWIFTPSAGRAGGQRQAFLDWRQALHPDTDYVRVLVVKHRELEEYKQAVAVTNGSSKPLHQTMIMTIPDKLDLAQLTGLSPAYRRAVQESVPDVSMGVGYARLCIQLVASVLQLPDVWMLDDNIQDCWQLDLDAASLHQPDEPGRSKHGDLQPCTFDTIMRGIEQQVSNTSGGRSPPLDGQSQNLSRCWDPVVSPREVVPPINPTANVQTWCDYSGLHSHYAIIGPSRQPYRYKLVGARWHNGAGPQPFTITHSVYSFFLLNVAATMGSSVLWPAKQYAEDIEFHHLCEDSKLAVVKCNRFFFHKANLQGVHLEQAAAHPRMSISPTYGPMWGGQKMQIDVLPTGVAQPVTVSICGNTANCDHGHILTPGLHIAAISSFGSQTNVVTGDVHIQSDVGQLTAIQQYTYHSVWEWAGEAGAVDVTTSNAGS